MILKGAEMPKKITLRKILHKYMSWHNKSEVNDAVKDIEDYIKENYTEKKK